MKGRPIMEIKEAINLFRSQIADTVPTIYATVIVCIYITFSYIKYTQNGFESDQVIFDNALYENNFKKWNEKWFFIFLYGFGKPNCFVFIQNMVEYDILNLRIVLAKIFQCALGTHNRHGGFSDSYHFNGNPHVTNLWYIVALGDLFFPVFSLL